MINLLILSGDVPLISKDTLNKLIDKHCSINADASILSSNVSNPYGYGRIKRNNANKFEAIIEHKDANENELKITEINSGIYIFNIKTLFQKLHNIKNNNSQNEYYIGDIFNFIDKDKISVLKTTKEAEISGINNIKQLNEVKKTIN